MKSTVIITGAGTGLGLDTAKALIARGHKVIATTFTEEQAQRLNNESVAFNAFKLDITNAHDRLKIASIDHDVLINNAGIGESGSLAEIPMEKVRNNFEVNVFSTFETAQVSLKLFIQKKRGKLLFISSLGGRIGLPWLAPYCMTKFALTAGAEQLRAEVRMLNKNIHVSVIEPGGYHTGFNQLNYMKKFEWMKDGYFKDHLDEILKSDEKQFKFVEVKSTKGIVRKIVKAVEANRPGFRYSAPWWQAWGTQVLRMVGK